MQNVFDNFSRKLREKTRGGCYAVLRQSSGQADLGQDVVVEKGVLQLAPAPGLIASVHLRQLVGVQVSRPLVGNRAGSESVFQLTPRKKIWIQGMYFAINRPGSRGYDRLKHYLKSFET